MLCQICEEVTEAVFQDILAGSFPFVEHLLEEAVS